MVELATALIWTMRIVLPIILFYIYFKLQAPKEQKYAGPQGNVYSRTTLLAHNRAPGVQGAPKPDEMGNLVLKDQAQAPELFAGTPAPRGRGAGQRGEPRQPGGKGREKGGHRETKERKEKRIEEEATEVVQPPPPEPEPAPVVPSEDKMHLESLLNYVAFHSKEQQRNFCVMDDGIPPPPPPAKSKPEGARGKVAIVQGAGAEKANTEAQMVLQGALDFKRVDIAKDIYARLVDAHVEISAKSFILMIEACVSANNLKVASDFLMKMETAGHTPEPELLDQVMDLYSKQKMQREVDKDPKNTTTTKDKEDTAAASRAKLSATASVFVPNFGIPPPPPMPPPDTAARQDPGEGAAATAEAPADGDAGAGEAKAEAAAPPERTKLVASSAAFVPQFGNMQFGNMQQQSWGDDFGWDGGKGGKGKDKGHEKGKEKGKDKGKGKGKWTDKGESKGDNKGKGKGKGKKKGEGDDGGGEGHVEGQGGIRSEDKADGKIAKGQGKSKMKWVKVQESQE